MSAGVVITGGSVSCTVTVKLALPVLPFASVAVQFTVVVPRPKVLPEDALHTGPTAPSTRSWAVTEKIAAAPAALVASRLMLPGTVIAGAVESLTATLKLAEALFPRVSEAAQVTVVLPMANVLPEAGAHDTERSPSTMSLAVGGLHDATAPLAPVASTVMSAGAPLIDGAVVSTTRTTKLELPVLFELSLAEQVTVVSPKANCEPEAGKQVAMRPLLTESATAGRA